MEGRYSRRKRVNTSFEYADCAQEEKRLKQPSYEPVQSESMSKEELSAWRKAQRRLRNRQSAAASRMKQKCRIDELELEVSKLKALLSFYEKGASPPPPPSLSRQKSIPISPPSSPALQGHSSNTRLKPRLAMPYLWLAS